MFSKPITANVKTTAKAGTDTMKRGLGKVFTGAYTLTCQVSNQDLSLGTSRGPLDPGPLDPEPLDPLPLDPESSGLSIKPLRLLLILWRGEGLSSGRPSVFMFLRFSFHPFICPCIPLFLCIFVPIFPLSLTVPRFLLSLYTFKPLFISSELFLYLIMFLCSSLALFSCSSVPLFHCSTIPVFYYSNLPLFQSSTIPVFYYSNLPLFQSFTIPIFYYSNLPLFQYFTIPIFHYSNFLLFQSSTVPTEFVLLLLPSSSGLKNVPLLFNFRATLLQLFPFPTRLCTIFITVPNILPSLWFKQSNCMLTVPS